MTLSRRQFILSSAAALGSTAVPSLAWGAISSGATSVQKEARNLSMYNIHTGETFKGAYWEQGSYLKDATSTVNHFMRDRRSGDVCAMDNQLIDLLSNVQSVVGEDRTLHVLCGYRSPVTNAKMHQRSRGVAKNSQHIYGKAVDFYVPGIKLSELKKIATSFKSGGVGYYPSSGFIHVDVRNQPAYW
ncbi:MAG: DUF882 domain-containing protein, partial [bacterium]|nr:DUF882 domain-containing protein [bacterium]